MGTGRAEGLPVNPLLVSQAGLITLETSLGQTIVSKLEVILVSCALIHMVFILFGIVLPFPTLAFASMALQRVRRDTAGKSSGALH